MSDKKVNSSPLAMASTSSSCLSSAGPWSSFHSSITLSARGPTGTPVRQSETMAVNEGLNETIATDLQQRFTELDLLLEYKLLCLNSIKGVYVMPSSKSLFEWHGVIFVHSGPFKDGVFRFTMFIPDGFPKQRPLLRFHSQIYHPYIHSSNRVLNMMRAFPSWDPQVHHLWHIIQYTQDCFYNPETWQEADQNVLIPQAQACALQSFKNVYDPVDDEGRNLICFGEYNEDQFREAFHTLIKGELPRTKQSGHSQSMLSNVTGHVKQLWDRMITR